MNQTTIQQGRCKTGLSLTAAAALTLSLLAGCGGWCQAMFAGVPIPGVPAWGIADRRVVLERRANGVLQHLEGRGLRYRDVDAAKVKLA
jgi:hypothetical protein